MNKPATALFIAVAAVTGVKAQGLLSIGPNPGLLNLQANHDFDDKLPFSVTLASSVGWDSNMNSSPNNEHSSGYWQNGVSVFVPMGDRRNHLTLGAHYSNIWYFDPAEGEEDTYNNARFQLDFTRQISRRLTISDSLYVSYETEPDYLIGASTSRRTSQYLYGYNNLAISYQWTPRFSTVTSYTITGVRYDETEDQNLNSFTHIFNQQFRYSLSKLTTATLDYRVSFSSYENSDAGDSVSQYALIGVDHVFSPALTGSLRVGAEFRDYDSGGTHTAPYVEGALNYRVGKDTTFRWFHWLGYTDNDAAGVQTEYSYRTGVTLEQRLAQRLTGSLSLHYIHGDFENGGVLSDYSEDTFAGSIGLDYRLWRNISLNGSYWYSINSSDNEFREYDRHRVSLGVNATF